MKHQRPKMLAAAVAALILLSVEFISSGKPLVQNSSPPGQEKPQAQTGGTLKVSIEVVNVYAVVREHDRLIPNLDKGDFEIAEDNVPQQVRYFSRQTDTPLTMAIAVDTSGSQQKVLPIEQEQAKIFLNQVLRPKDLACVLHFDLEVELLQDFTAENGRLAKAIDETQINAGGQGPLPGTFPTGQSTSTALYDAIYLASHDLLKSEIGRKVLILLTDGQDEGSRETLNHALQAAQKADVIIYAVNIADRAFSGGSFNGDSVLSKLSSETGGRVIRVSRARDAAAAFQAIAEELRTQYLLGYTPSNTKHDGAYRKIRVRVTHGKYKVQARRGYYAPAE